MEQRKIPPLFVIPSLICVTILVAPCCSLIFVVLGYTLQHIAQFVAFPACAVSAIAIRYRVVRVYQIAHKVSLHSTAGRTRASSGTVFKLRLNPAPQAKRLASPISRRNSSRTACRYLMVCRSRCRTCCRSRYPTIHHLRLASTCIALVLVRDAFPHILRSLLRWHLAAIFRLRKIPPIPPYAQKGVPAGQSEAVLRPAPELRRGPAPVALSAALQSRSTPGIMIALLLP